MLDDNSVSDGSGVVLGHPGYGNNLVNQVSLTEENRPPRFLSQHLEQSVRTGMLDCKPRFGHDGRLWESI